MICPIRYSRLNIDWETREAAVAAFSAAGAEVWGTLRDGRISPNGWKAKAARELGVSAGIISYWSNGHTVIPQWALDVVANKLKEKRNEK